MSIGCLCTTCANHVLCTTTSWVPMRGWRLMPTRCWSGCGPHPMSGSQLARPGTGQPAQKVCITTCAMFHGPCFKMCYLSISWTSPSLLTHQCHQGSLSPMTVGQHLLEFGFNDISFGMSFRETPGSGWLPGFSRCLHISVVRTVLGGPCPQWLRGQS